MLVGALMIVLLDEVLKLFHEHNHNHSLNHDNESVATS